ncbi:MAG TPA: ATP-binding cassette domain-containing protein, partial [Chloroflexota bacterium]
MNDLLDVEGLTKRFRLHGLGGREIVGCREVSFRLQSGQCLALIGQSGAGKSTVLKCLYRTYLPSAGAASYLDAGDVRIDLATAPDRDLLRLRRLEIAYVSQFLRAVPRVGAVDVVAEPLALAGEPLDEAR